MIVYIEYVLINNFLIDYALLFFTYSLIKKRVKWYRIAPASLFGALFALVFPLISAHTVLLTVIKLLVGVLLVFISAPFTRAKDFYVATLVFLTLTFLTGGAIMGFNSLFNLQTVGELFIAVMTLPAYAVLKLMSAVITFLVRKKQNQGLLYDFTIAVNGVSKRLVGLMDTGNEVYFRGEPVIFIDSLIVKDFLRGGLFKMQKIHIDTITGGGEKICFVAPTFEIYIGDKANIFNNVRVCVADNIKGGYDAILHPAFLEVSDESVKKQVKKVG